MLKTTFDLDFEVVPANSLSPEEVAANPLAVRAMEEKCSCTTPTINTYTYGVAKCYLCCA